MNGSTTTVRVEFSAGARSLIQVVATQHGMTALDVERAVRAAMQEAVHTPSEVDQTFPEPIARFTSVMTLHDESYDVPARLEEHHTWLSRARIVLRVRGEDDLTIRAFLTTAEGLDGETMNEWVVDVVA